MCIHFVGSLNYSDQQVSLPREWLTLTAEAAEPSRRLWIVAQRGSMQAHQQKQKTGCAASCMPSKERREEENEDRKTDGETEFSKE